MTAAIAAGTVALALIGGFLGLVVLLSLIVLSALFLFFFQRIGRVKLFLFLVMTIVAYLGIAALVTFVAAALGIVLLALLPVLLLVLYLRRALVFS